jgi:hypothetical protein
MHPDLKACEVFDPHRRAKHQDRDGKRGLRAQSLCRGQPAHSWQIVKHSRWQADQVLHGGLIIKLAQARAEAQEDVLKAMAAEHSQLHAHLSKLEASRAGGGRGDGKAGGSAGPGGGADDAEHDSWTLGAFFGCLFSPSPKSPYTRRTSGGYFIDDEAKRVLYLPLRVAFVGACIVLWWAISWTRRSVSSSP